MFYQFLLFRDFRFRTKLPSISKSGYSSQVNLYFLIQELCLTKSDHHFMQVSPQNLKMSCSTNLLNHWWFPSKFWNWKIFVFDHNRRITPWLIDIIVIIMNLRPRQFFSSTSEHFVGPSPKLGGLLPEVWLWTEDRIATRRFGLWGGWILLSQTGLESSVGKRPIYLLDMVLIGPIMEIFLLV